MTNILDNSIRGSIGVSRIIDASFDNHEEANLSFAGGFRLFHDHHTEHELRLVHDRRVIKPLRSFALRVLLNGSDLKW